MEQKDVETNRHIQIDGETEMFRKGEMGIEIKGRKTLRPRYQDIDRQKKGQRYSVKARWRHGKTEIQRDQEMKRQKEAKRLDRDI